VLTDRLQYEVRNQVLKLQALHAVFGTSGGDLVEGETRYIIDRLFILLLLKKTDERDGRQLKTTRSVVVDVFV
jgi:hypothetical protein